jgi:hypothetical protein
MDPHASGITFVGAVTDVLLHPEYAAEVFADFFGSLTLAAASEKPIGGRECVGAEYKLILLPSAKGASLSVKFSADGTDSANLFVHKTSGDWSDCRAVWVPFWW